MSDLPDTFDYIVWGAGLSECILSAALTRAGHSVLHLDSWQQYGGAWQSPTLRDLESQLAEVAPGARLAWAQPAEADAWRSRSRYFCLDLSPRLCFCRGDTVSALLQSDVSRYLEFLPVSGLYTVDEAGCLERAPVQRGQLFRSDRFSLVEKLHCGRFAEFCVSCQPDRDLADAGSFPELLARHGLRSGPAQRLFALAVGMSPPDSPAETVVAGIRRFLASCGAYGPSPLLVPKYGASEICQAFSRHAAVWGAVFHLGADPDRPPAEARRRLIVSDRFAQSGWLDLGRKRRLFRQILVTDGSWAPRSEDQQDADEVRLAVCMLPGFTRPLLAMELPPETGCCPTGTRVVHLLQPCSPGESPPTDCVQCALAPFTGLRFERLPPCCQCASEPTAANLPTETALDKNLGQSDSTGQPADSAGQPADSAGQPADSVGQRADSMSQTADSVSQPDDSVGQLADSARQPDDSVGQPADSASQPANSTGQPADSAIQPADSASQSADSAEQPADSSGQPADSAGQPADSADQPAAAADDQQPFRKPSCILSVCFVQDDLSDCLNPGALPDNVTVVPSLYSDFDFDVAFQRAKELFDELCPGQEFLPRPPDQEDLVFDQPASEAPTVNGDCGEGENEGAAEAAPPAAPAAEVTPNGDSSESQPENAR
ncbi:hypothetical protein BOX15_Mlig007424g1 [Macrostomum lignano]|uniref:Rab proteins geranylgeranyltransferase component A n=1 Tax=Macrostomum lignano TaxID=282301 RepID=A0A267FGI9_9PLAT|nr:hypothetical protein BOX15_Mlig007424g1 [Macrostomum lignano]